MVGLWGGGARSSHLPTPCSAVSPGILGSAQGSLWGGGPSSSRSRLVKPGCKAPWKVSSRRPQPGDS